MGLFRRKAAPVQVIDLRDPAPPRPAPVWGSPAPCPACGARGYIDRIDLRAEVMFQHCPDCWHKYEIARSDIEPDLEVRADAVEG